MLDPLPALRTIPALLLLFVVVVGCNRTTLKRPHTVNGQVFYTERAVPSFGDTVWSAAQGCEGGVRNDDRALERVPTPQGCKRNDFVVDYTVDGIYRIVACDDVYRVRCRKSTAVSAMTGPTSCVVLCTLEDHFVPGR